MARYDAGETLASIARTYDCSPPAISYVVSRSRARHGGVAPAPSPVPASEPQLVKAAVEGMVGANTDGTGRAQQPSATPPPAESFLRAAPLPPPIPAAAERSEIRPRDANGYAQPIGGEREPHPRNPFLRTAPPTVPRPVVPQTPDETANGDQRRTLHLSLGNGSHANGGGQPVDVRSSERPHAVGAPQPAPTSAAERRPPWAQRDLGTFDQGRRETGQAAPSGGVHADRDGMTGRNQPEPIQAREGVGAYIDRELRARVDGDIATFLAAFDTALSEDTLESRAALREATDRLLRAGARTRIELERLEARFPLSSRDNYRQGEPSWRR